jgi:hypothetical protein
MASFFPITKRHEAMQMQQCMSIMGPDAGDYCRQEVLGIPIPAPPPPVTCDPSRALTWADFAGPVPASSPFGAETHWDQTEGIDSYNRRVIKATFDGAASWVKPRSSGAANRADNGCEPEVTRCTTLFNSLGPGQTAWATLGPVTGCAAAFQHNTTLRATSLGECETVLGAECDRVALLNSARLLAHEQLHFDIACLIAKKGTDHLASNSRANPTTILNTVKTKTNAQTALYDTQTNHGCNAGPQATWVRNVAAGLTSVTIP